MKVSRCSLVAMFLMCSMSARGGVFYLLDNTRDRLLAGDLSDPAAAQPLAALLTGSWLDLAAASVPDQVFAVEANARKIYTLNGINGSIINQITVDREIRSIAYDISAGVMYGLPQSGGLELFTVDMTTGETSLIGQTGILESAVLTFGMGYDVSNATLYVSTDSRLYAIDPTNAATSLIGTLSLNRVFDVAYNFADGQLYATDISTNSLYRVDRTNANLTLIGGSYENSTLGTGLEFAIPEPAAAYSLSACLLLIRRRRTGG